MRLNEIFESIQGEGHFTGTQAIFVRFADCNLSCSFCDTDYSCKFDMTESELIKEIKKSNLRHIVLTGGEPTLQIKPNDRGYNEFVRKLRDLGYYVQIETNGTNPIPKNVDWITISPKKKWRIKEGNEIKVVYNGQSLIEYLDTDFDYYYLQPCEEKDKMNIKETIQKVKEYPQWKLSIQIQKLLKIK
jgi:organic radical activating enzyme